MAQLHEVADDLGRPAEVVAGTVSNESGGSVPADRDGGDAAWPRRREHRQAAPRAMRMSPSICRSIIDSIIRSWDGSFGLAGPTIRRVPALLDPRR